MPNGYTHVATGMKALHKSEYKASSLLAFGAGANGPDPLFFHKVWNRKRQPNLLEIGSMMHKVKTGSFLTALAKYADTPVKRSYVAGFLTHYATDKTAHPYVAFLTEEENAPYQIPHGHGFYECGLDSELYQKDFGTRRVKANRSIPLPKKEDLREITDLFHTAFSEVYGQDIPEDMLMEAFHDILLMRNWFTSRWGFRRAIYFVAERLLFKEPGYILSNLTPGNRLKELPKSWRNPFTGEQHMGGIDELLVRAEDVGAEFINRVNAYWKKLISLEEFSDIIGNKSYETGLELE